LVDGIFKNIIKSHKNVATLYSKYQFILNHKTNELCKQCSYSYKYELCTPHFSL
jgi:hypothetical protein